MTECDIQQIADSILELVASKSKDGNWWGDDTDCGDATSKAVEILKKAFLYKLRDGTFTTDIGEVAKAFMESAG